MHLENVHFFLYTGCNQPIDDTGFNDINCGKLPLPQPEVAGHPVAGPSSDPVAGPSSDPVAGPSSGRISNANPS